MFVRAKRKLVERLEARRARLLAGLRRVHPLCLSGRSASSLSGLKHDERGCLRDCDGSTSVLSGRSVSSLSGSKDERALLLAGLQRVSVPLRCCISPTTESLWLLVRWQSAVHYFCFNNGYLAHLRWWPSAAPIASFIYVFDDLLLVFFSCVLLLPLQSCAILFLFCSVILWFRRPDDCYAQRASETDKRQ